jgi:hypothetical protein
MEHGHVPTILVTNDDGIDAPGLRALVRALVSTDRFNVQVCAPDSCVAICVIYVPLFGYYIHFFFFSFGFSKF